MDKQTSLDASKTFTNNKVVKTSRIPMLQRTPSLRLKGEKSFAPSIDSNTDLHHKFVFLNGNSQSGRISSAVDNRRDSLHKLTRSTSLNDKLHLHEHKAKDIFKYNSLNYEESQFPTEYEPLSISPDADDACSISSFRSLSSAMSFSTHATNKKKKFVVHCPNHSEQEEYLTPTQRKDRQIRQLKAQLMKARREIDEKEAGILLLTKEVGNLRATISNFAGKSKDQDTKSCREVLLDDVFRSNADSGLCEQFDEIRESDVTLNLEDVLPNRSSLSSFEEIYKKEMETLKRNHTNEYQEMKEKYNDRIESLLQKLSEANTKYFDLRPKYDNSQELLKQQENKITLLQNELADQEKRHHQMYLKMYKKGQEAAKFEHADEVLEFAHQAPKRVAVPELLQQLKVTEHELDRVKALYRREMYKRSDNLESEMTLRFLKDVIYHFLTNKDSRDHLRAIENILGYSDNERKNIERSVLVRSKLIG